MRECHQLFQRRAHVVLTIQRYEISFKRVLPLPVVGGEGSEGGEAGVGVRHGGAGEAVATGAGGALLLTCRTALSRVEPATSGTAGRHNVTTRKLGDLSRLSSCYRQITLNTAAASQWEVFGTSGKTSLGTWGNIAFSVLVLFIKYRKRGLVAKFWRK